jgi:hypothetical protein
VVGDSVRKSSGVLVPVVNPENEGVTVMSTALVVLLDSLFAFLGSISPGLDNIGSSTYGSVTELLSPVPSKAALQLAALVRASGS